MMDFIYFLPEELFIIVVASYIVGLILKKIDIVDDRYITIFITIFSIGSTIAMNGFSTNSMLLGVIASGIAVLGNQTVKQLLKKKEEEERE